MEGARLPKARWTRAPEAQSLRKASQLLPFEKLPNLPSPIIPSIDLGVGSRTDIKAIEVSFAISDQRRIGFFVSDGTTQTDASQIVDVKDVTHVIETLLQDVAQLRKDLNFAQNVLRADYENKLNQRAAELYCRVNEKTSEIEKHHKEKLEIVRRSYHQQLINAIQKIAGEYKAYYDDLMSGKTGRHDLKIKELKEKVIEQEQLLEVQALRTEDLMARIGQLEDKEHEDEPSFAEPSVSPEEVEKLQETIADMQAELIETRIQLNAKEDLEKNLMRQLNTTTRDLETEKGKVVQLRKDMEGLKKRSKAEQEKAARLAESQRASLEKEMRERVDKAQNDAALQAQCDAEQHRMQEQAALELERERSHRREEELRAQHSAPQPRAMSESEHEAELARLQLTDTRQREEINRLHKELERVNRVWSTKLAIMQNNFHALRDECFLRSSLQRQAATLHHATLGYAVTGYHIMSKQNDATVQSQAQFTGSECNDSTCLRIHEDRLSVPPPPTPTQITPRELRTPSRSQQPQ